jgi:uncharacterized protein (DUF983 family)
MHLVRRYQRVFEAESMATALREQGINCAVVGHHTQAAIGMEGGRVPWFGYDLVVLQKHDVEPARRMMSELESERVEPEEGWEEESRPDLSVLEGMGLVVRCPSCELALPLDETMDECPACSAEVDVVDQLVQAHGPEVLDACYGIENPASNIHAREAPEVDYDPALVRMPCAGCGEVLAEGISGRCPSCGTLFDKRDMLGR